MRKINAGEGSSKAGGRAHFRGTRVLAALVAAFSVVAVAFGAAGVARAVVGDARYTVQGVSPRGTTINLFDYWITSQDDPDNVTQSLVNDDGELNARYTQGINADHVL